MILKKDTLKWQKKNETAPLEITKLEVTKQGVLNIHITYITSLLPQSIKPPVKMKENNKLIPIQSTGLVKVSNSIAITNKLLKHKAEISLKWLEGKQYPKKRF